MTSKEFDIPGRTFDFVKDLKFGEAGEETIKGFLDALSGGAFEVKSDRYRNGRMVVETEQNPRGIKDSEGTPVWVKSGINVTTAKWWVYVYSPDNAFVVISVSRLKNYLRSNKNKYSDATKRNFGGSDNPAKGFLIMETDVVDLLTNPQYD